MVQIINLSSLMEKLGKRVDLAKQVKDAGTTVGFTQRYAIYVHENLQAHHPVGQAKFLEAPARSMGSELGGLIGEALTNGAPFQKALMIAGYRLQREAQLLCPVDTSALKASAFTCPTSNENSVADAAFAKSDMLRTKVGTKRKGMTKKQIAGIKQRQRATWLQKMASRGKRP